jgi:hypothetical protein
MRLPCLLDRFTGFAGALLNAAQKFIVLAFEALEIIRELGPLLFQLALGLFQPPLISSVFIVLCFVFCL